MKYDTFYTGLNNVPVKFRVAEDVKNIIQKRKREKKIISDKLHKKEKSFFRKIFM